MPVSLILMCTFTIVCYGTLISTPPPPDFSKVGYDGVISWAVQRTKNAEATFGQGPRMPSPTMWQSQVIYAVMPDRFANGNVSNDFANVPPLQAQFFGTPNPQGVWSWRHGGDILGLENRLDYLVDLGVTTLWITPVLMNCGGEYHGYCTSDPTRIDPNFGSWDDYRGLVRACHARGLYVVQGIFFFVFFFPLFLQIFFWLFAAFVLSLSQKDIVINHQCGCDSRYASPPVDHEKCAATLNGQFWGGTPVGDNATQGTLQFGPNFFGPLKSAYFFNRCGANSLDDTDGTGPATTYGDFVSTMLDFATPNYQFQDIFLELMKVFVALDVDGFRLDAAKHVTEDFLANFATKMRAYAKTLGKQNLIVMGEVAAPEDWIGRRLGAMESDPKNPQNHGNVPKSLTEKLLTLQSIYLQNAAAPFPGLNAVYDFDASGTSRSVFRGEKASSELASYFNSDYYRTISGQSTDANLMWVHLEIPDWPRFLAGSDHEGNAVASMVGASWLLTGPGQPIIYAGFEQGFNQNCHFDSIEAGTATDSIKQLCNDGGDDSLKRQDMFAEGPWRLGSAVSEIDALNYIGVWTPKQTNPNWQQDPYLKRDHALYQTVRRLIAVRKSCGPLNHGQLVWRNAEPQVNGFLVFSRLIAGEAEMVVIINPASTGVSIPPIPIDPSINYDAPYQTYVNLLDGFQKATVGYQSGAPFLYLPSGFVVQPNSYLIFAHTNNVGPFNTSFQTLLCKSETPN